MPTPSRTPAFNTRAFISLSLIFSFVWLPPSGVLLHLTAQEGMTTLRHAVMSVHNFASLAFLCAALAHVALNAKSIGNALINKTRALPTLKKEALVAFAVTTLFVFLLASHALHQH